jgi:DNA-binding beta-propeller fold protein YncE
MKKLHLGFLSFALIGALIPESLHAAAGDLYMAKRISHRVDIFSPKGTETTFAYTPGSPSGVAFDAKGNVYVAETDASGGYVIKYTPGGAQSTIFASGLADVNGLAFDGSGNLFVTEFLAGTITKITPAGTKTLFASGLSGAAGLAFDSAGNLYEADNSSGKIFKFTPAGTKTLFASGFSAPNGPYGLAFRTGTLYVTDTAAGNVFVISPTGAKTTPAFISGLGSPQGIAFDGSSLSSRRCISCKTLARAASSALVTTGSSPVSFSAETDRLTAPWSSVRLARR